MNNNRQNSEELNILKLNDELLLSFLQNNTTIILSQQIINNILIKDYKNYSNIFYYLSLSNQVIYENIYLDLYLHKHFLSFNEEDFYYIAEGLKIEAARQNTGLFCIFHIDFLVFLHKSHSLQKLLLHLLEYGNYRIREIIFTFDFIKDLFFSEKNNRIVLLKNAKYDFYHKNNDNLNILNNDIFFVKFMQLLIKPENIILLHYVKNHNLKKTIEINYGCLMFFPHWLKKAGNILNEAIKVICK